LRPGERGLFTLAPLRGQESEGSRERICRNTARNAAVAFPMATELDFKRLRHAAGNGTAPVPYKEQIFPQLQGDGL
jgi:hypothetical protein